MASYELRATLPGLTQGVTVFVGHAGAAPKWMLTLCESHVSAKPRPISNFGSLKQQIWTHRFPFRNCHKSGSNRTRFGQNPGWFNLLTSSYAERGGSLHLAKTAPNLEWQKSWTMENGGNMIYNVHQAGTVLILIWTFMGSNMCLIRTKILKISRYQSLAMAEFCLPPVSNSCRSSSFNLSISHTGSGFPGPPKVTVSEVSLYGFA